MLDTALAYADGGWPVFPCIWAGPRRKRPLTPRGFKEADTDRRRIANWWGRWPRALIGTPTGRDFVVLDIDPQHGGFDTLSALGFLNLPPTLTAITCSGGRHLYFALPDRPIRNTGGARGRGIGSGLDWRGIGGYVIVPAPGTGYEWQQDTLSLALASIPAALMPRDGEPQPAISGTPAVCNELSPYGEAALRSAAGKILCAPNGEQEATLNGESYSIGRLAGCGGVPGDLALDILLTAALAIPSYDPRRPWRTRDIEKKVRAAFAEGLANPRPSWLEMEREFDRRMAEVTDVC
jgi:hypothetical protein